MLNRSILGRHDLSAFFARHADLAVGVGILSVLALLIVPIPSFVLDLFICVSFCASLLMLSTTLYVAKPVELASFPSLLLLSTLLRLALAIASTKMILLHAHAGAIISAFGEMVVGGNVAVGLVVFICCRQSSSSSWRRARTASRKWPRASRSTAFPAAR